MPSAGLRALRRIDDQVPGDRNHLGWCEDVWEDRVTLIGLNHSRGVWRLPNDRGSAAARSSSYRRAVGCSRLLGAGQRLFKQSKTQVVELKVIVKDRALEQVRYRLQARSGPRSNE